MQASCSSLTASIRDKRTVANKDVPPPCVTQRPFSHQHVFLFHWQTAGSDHSFHCYLSFTLCCPLHQPSLLSARCASCWCAGWKLPVLHRDCTKTWSSVFQWCVYVWTGQLLCLFILPLRVYLMHPQYPSLKCSFVFVLTEYKKVKIEAGGLGVGACFHHLWFYATQTILTCRVTFHSITQHQKYYYLFSVLPIHHWNQNDTPSPRPPCATKLKLNAV